MDDVLFIHPTKTGGTTIFNLLGIEKLSGIGRIPKQSIRKGRVCFAHISMELIIDSKIPTQEWLDNSYKFISVRNPYERAVSEWAFQIDNGYKRYKKTCTFKGHVDNLKGHSDFRPQIEYMKGPYDIDFTVRFENFEDDVKRLALELGDGEVEVPHLNKSKHRPWRDHYTPELQRKVYEFYAEDFEAFGYDKS